MPGEEEAEAVKERLQARNRLISDVYPEISHISSASKIGHYASDCPDKQLKLQETVEKKEEDTHEADELMMNEVFYLNERKVNPNAFEAE